MITDRTPEYLIGLVHELRKLPSETEWLEFKRNEPSRKTSVSTCLPWPMLRRCTAK